MDATLRVGENDRMPEDSTCRNADRFQTLCFINSFRKSRVVRFFLKGAPTHRPLHVFFSIQDYCEQVRQDAHLWYQSFLLDVG